jgi:hypothetical protein
MSEGVSTNEPPTYFANIVTLQVTVDETVLKFRRYLLPHKEQLKLKQEGARVWESPQLLLGLGLLVR